MKVVGDVPCGKDPLHVRPAKLVHDDTVVNPDRGAGDDVRRGLDADAHNREVAVDPTATRRDDTLHAFGRSLEACDAFSEEGFNTVLLVERRHDAADVRA